MPLFLTIGIVGVILIGEGFDGADHAARAAAVDGWLDADGLRLEGGLRDGTRVPRSQLASAAVVEKERSVKGVLRVLRYVFGKGPGNESYAELVVEDESGAAITLAEAMTTAERRILARAAEVLAGRTPPASHARGGGAGADDAALAAIEPTAVALVDGAPTATSVRRIQRIAAWPISCSASRRSSNGAASGQRARSSRNRYSVSRGWWMRSRNVSKKYTIAPSASKRGAAPRSRVSRTRWRKAPSRAANVRCSSSRMRSAFIGHPGLPSRRGRDRTGQYAMA